MRGWWPRAAVVLVPAAAFVLAVPALAGSRPDAARWPRPLVQLDGFARRERASTASDASAADAGAVSSEVSVVVPSGPLTMFHVPDAVTLHRVPGTDRFRGEVSGLRVVDARGTDAGWRLTLTVPRDESTFGDEKPSVAVGVERIVAMARSTDGVRATRHASGALGRPVFVASADPGGSGGAFDVTFVVETLVHGAAPDAIRFDLRFDLA